MSIEFTHRATLICLRLHIPERRLGMRGLVSCVLYKQLVRSHKADCIIICNIHWALRVTQICNYGQNTIIDLGNLVAEHANNRILTSTYVKPYKSLRTPPKSAVRNRYQKIGRSTVVFQSMFDSCNSIRSMQVPKTLSHKRVCLP
jgi:hypothetical protein